jgi:putative ABC transport system permease protein
MRTIDVDRGRLISQADCDQARRVVVIGTEASRQLFADRDPVGAALSLNGMPYTVIGRVRKKDQDSNYTGPDNERLFLPYETARKDFPLPDEESTADSLSTIIAAPFPEESAKVERWVEEEGIGAFLSLEFLGPVERDVLGALAPGHGFDPEDPEALSMWNTAISAVLFAKMIAAMHQFFVAVSLITLALGGIGVMNIMIVAVKERTREIGVLKAVGATSRAVLWQFFSEGLALTFVSGGVGYAIGVGLCLLVSLLPMPARFGGLVITWQTTVLAVLVLAVIGVAASVYPARRAAKLQPIEALRYEM